MLSVLFIFCDFFPVWIINKMKLIPFFTETITPAFPTICYTLETTFFLPHLPCLSSLLLIDSYTPPWTYVLYTSLHASSRCSLQKFSPDEPKCDTCFTNVRMISFIGRSMAKEKNHIISETPTTAGVSLCCSLGERKILHPPQKNLPPQ